MHSGHGHGAKQRAISSDRDALVERLDALLSEVDVTVETGAEVVSTRRRLLAARSLAANMTPHIPPRLAVRPGRVSDRVAMPSDRPLEIPRRRGTGNSVLRAATS